MEFNEAAWLADMEGYVVADLIGEHKHVQDKVEQALAYAFLEGDDGVKQGRKSRLRVTNTALAIMKATPGCAHHAERVEAKRRIAERRAFKAAEKRMAKENTWGTW